MRRSKIICTKHKTHHTEQLRSKAVKLISGRWQQCIHYTTSDVLAHLATASFMNFIGTASTAWQPVIIFCSCRRAQTLFYPLHYTSITKMIVLQQSVLLHALVRATGLKGITAFSLTDIGRENFYCNHMITICSFTAKGMCSQPPMGLFKLYCIAGMIIDKCCSSKINTTTIFWAGSLCSHSQTYLLNKSNKLEANWNSH